MVLVKILLILAISLVPIYAIWLDVSLRAQERLNHFNAIMARPSGFFLLGTLQGSLAAGLLRLIS